MPENSLILNSFYPLPVCFVKQTEWYITDEEVEDIWNRAEHDAINCVHPNSIINPYIEAEQAEIYEFALRFYLSKV